MNDRTMKMTADLSAHQFSTRDELRGFLPRRPCLIPELVMVPLTKTSLAVYGASQPRVLECRQGLHGLYALFAALDGKRTLDELVAELSTPIEGGVFGIVSLLFRYGFLEDGPVDDDAGPVSSYCGRFVDIARFHQNRYEALAKIARDHLAIACELALAETLRAAFAGVPFASVTFLGEAGDALPEARPGDARFGLVVFTNGADDETVLAQADSFHRAGLPYFVVAIGAETVQIGPLVLPNLSASHRCAVRQCPAPAGRGAFLKSAFWSVFGVHEMVNVLLGVSPECFINKMILHSTDGRGQLARTIAIARVPGAPFSGLEKRSALDPAEPAFKAWAHHVAVRIPPHDYAAPRSYQKHFSPGNLALHASPVSPMEELPGLVLPFPSPLPEALPWLATASASAGIVTLPVLSALLRYAAGYQTSPEGEKRWIAPSGGQLASCGLYVHIADVEGMEPGFYGYEGKAHRLVPVPADRPHRLRTLLAAEGALPPVSVFVIAHLDRARRKYADFGYNVVTLDAGVTIAYLFMLARAFGVALREDRMTDTSTLGRWLMLPTDRNVQRAAAVLHLGQAASSAAPSLRAGDTADVMAALESVPRPSFGAGPEPFALSEAFRGVLRARSAGRAFGDVMLSRRAVYAYADAPIDAPLLSALVGLSQTLLARRVEKGQPMLDLRPWLLVPETAAGLAAGIYDCGTGGSEWINRCPDVDRAAMAHCIIQKDLQKAGALLVIMGNLEAILSAFGPYGYRAALRQSASVLAEIWLAAVAAGLVGTMAGGVIEPGLMRLAGVDGYRESALFTLVLANPAEALSGHDA